MPPLLTATAPLPVQRQVLVGGVPQLLRCNGRKRTAHRSAAAGLAGCTCPTLYHASWDPSTSARPRAHLPIARAVSTGLLGTFLVRASWQQYKQTRSAVLDSRG